MQRPMLSKALRQQSSRSKRRLGIESLEQRLVLNVDFGLAVGFGSTLADVGNAITTDSSGNIYATGFFQGTADFDPGPGTTSLTSVGFRDLFVTKSDSSGNLIWARAVGGTVSDPGEAITVDSSGNVYMTGSFQGTVDFDPGAGVFNLSGSLNSASDVFILKLDSSGDFVWANRFGADSPDRGTDIKVDGSGNVYATGVFEDTVDFDPGVGTTNLTSVNSSPDAFVLKLTSAGTFVWARAFGGISFDVPHGLDLDSAGNVYTAGSFSFTVDFNPGAGTNNLVSNGQEDIFVSKLNNSGNFVWARKIGGTFRDQAFDIAVDSSGNVLTTGDFLFNVDFDPTGGFFFLNDPDGRNAFVSKLDTNGNFLWANQLGGTDSNDSGRGIALDSSDNVYTIGTFEGTADFEPGPGETTLTSISNADIYVSKLDSDGQFAWVRGFGNAVGVNPQAITVDNSSNVLTTGSFSDTLDFDPNLAVRNRTSTGSSDIYISKLTQPAATDDLGDAPDTYRTTVNAGPNGGARHTATGVTLGVSRDLEGDASRPLNGLGDDAVSTDDEDGVVVSDDFRLRPGSTATATVTLNGTGGSARVYGFVDFNGDGDFDEVGEEIADGSTTFGDGSHLINFSVPGTAVAGLTYARFRVSSDGGLSFDGTATDGEVEDYRVCIEDTSSGAAAECQLAVTPISGRVGSPHLNDDGSRIVFTTDNDLTGGNPDTNDEVFLFDATTGNYTQISDTVGFNSFQPVISPDGSRFMFTSSGDLTGGNPSNTRQFFMYEIATTSLTQVTTNTFFDPGNMYHSGVNTDGGFWVFESEGDYTGGNGDGNPEIFLFDRVGNSITQITNTTDGFNYQPMISANGNDIVFGSDRDLTGSNVDGSTELFVFDRALTTLTQLTNIAPNGDGFNDMAMSGDGMKIVFYNSFDPIGTNSDGNSEIFLFDRGTNNFTQITNTTGNINTKPDISSDGARVLIESDGNLTGDNPDGSSQAFVYDLATSKLVQITDIQGEQAGDEVNGVGDPPSINSDGTIFTYSLDRTFDRGFSSFERESELIVASLLQADLEVTQTSDATVGAGENFTYTITVTNNGPDTASDVTLTDILPAEVSFVSSVPAGPTCTESSGTVTCNLGNLNATASTQVDITVMVLGNTPVGTELSNPVSVASETIDPIGANNDEIETTNVVESGTNVTGQVLNGRLELTGDAGDNDIQLNIINRRATVRGLNGTKINGEGVINFGGILNGIFVSMAKGNDNVSVVGRSTIGNNPSPVRLIGGSGNDTITIRDAIEGPVQLIGGSGADNLRVFDAILSDSLSIVGNTGNDSVVIQDSLVDGAAGIQTGADNDRIFIDDSRFTQKVTINTADGADKIDIDRRDRSGRPRPNGLRVRFVDRVILRTGDGNDRIRIGLAGSGHRSALFQSPTRTLLHGGTGTDILDSGVLSNPNANGNQFSIRPVRASLENVVS